MNDARVKKIEFGDFQTPDGLAAEVCKRLSAMGISPAAVIEPTCGIGAFVAAALEAFRDAKIVYGIEVNEDYLARLRQRLADSGLSSKTELLQADFFRHDWLSLVAKCSGEILVLGNFPWVTNSVQGAIGGSNLPEKSNFQGRVGFDAISGKANFDISEWMLLDVLRWFKGRSGTVAMLVKSAVARKVLAQAEGMGIAMSDAMMFGIDAKKEFGAMVDACLLVMRIGTGSQRLEHDYTIYANLSSSDGRRVGHRHGLTIGDLDSFERWKSYLGRSPQKWRSGIKHDASSIMEFTRVGLNLYKNGLGETVQLEPLYLYPLLKGSDVGSNRQWREKFVLVTQKTVGDSTDSIREQAPMTWEYLESQGAALDRRGSVIYKKNPRFSIFGVGDYAFRPWRIAICALYKKLQFRLVGPIDEKPVMVDDTAYYVSFDSEQEALGVLDKLRSDGAQAFLGSLIFWDEKRPIKTSILNSFDWTSVKPI